MNHSAPSSCHGLTINRRDVLKALASLPILGKSAKASTGEPPSGAWSEKAVVARVYLCGKTTHWPRYRLNMDSERAAVEKALGDLQSQHAKTVSFVGGEVLAESAEAAPWAKKYANADALLVIPLATPAPGVNALLDVAKLPTVVLSHIYAGHQWAQVAEWRKAGHRVDCLATREISDLAAYMPLFRAIQQMCRSRVLIGAANKTGWYHACQAEFAKHFGMTFQYFNIEELMPCFQQADATEAKAEAEVFMRKARRVAEPKPQEIHDAFRFYHGLRNMMAREKANAFTIDCFPAILGKKLPAYPCLAWCLLNDQGFYGVCQADVRATMTQLLVTSFSGMPGFVNNPVFDVPRNEMIYSHCVAATHMMGIKEKPSPYLIRSHLETEEGAVLQVVMPTDRFVTVGQFADPKTFLLTTGEAIGTTSAVSGNRDADCGCRTKVRVRVHGDTEKWLANYTTGVHRVVFYGDHVKAIERLGRLLGFEVVKEA